MQEHQCIYNSFAHPVSLYIYEALYGESQGGLAPGQLIFNSQDLYHLHVDQLLTINDWLHDKVRVMGTLERRVARGGDEGRSDIGSIGVDKGRRRDEGAVSVRSGGREGGECGRSRAGGQ